MWQYHDNKIKELKVLYDKTSLKTRNRIQELIDTFNFNNNTIYNIADNKTKKRIDSYIEKWKDDGLLKGYFGVLAQNIYRRKNVKNSEILELLIYGAYLEENLKQEEKEKQIFKEDISYYYNEGINEVRKARNHPPLFCIIPDSILLALMEEINSMGYTWKQYNELTIMNSVNQIYRQLLINIQQQKESKMDSNEFKSIFDRQTKQKVSINEGKISGAVDIELIGLNNQAKIKGIESEDNDAQVIFLANIDGKETDMCHSLNNQKFYINEDNEFNRYYGETQKDLSIRRIKCKGLVLGLNLPPISHHFHYCRSMIQYIPKRVENNEKMEYNIDNFLRTETYQNKDYEDYIEDYQQVRKEYDMLPDTVKKRLFSKEKIKVVFNYSGRQTSGYNPNTKEILLVSGVEKGEFIHEIGHALYYSLDIDKYTSYQNVINNMMKNCVIKEFKDKEIPYYGIETTYNVASNYQTFLGYDKITAQIKLNQGEFIETMSEAYREYYYGKNQSIELNKLIEEVENNA